MRLLFLFLLYGYKQLFDHFRIKNNYIKTFEGFKTRISAKMKTLTLVQ